MKFQPALVEAISKVFDPEIPVNIYELGLVYDLEVDANSNVQVRMTLTAPACPAAQTIPIDVERRIREVAGVNDVKVKIVWDPPWTRDKMSEAAKLSLGIGLNLPIFQFRKGPEPGQYRHNGIAIPGFDDFVVVRLLRELPHQVPIAQQAQLIAVDVVDDRPRRRGGRRRFGRDTVRRQQLRGSPACNGRPLMLR